MKKKKITSLILSVALGCGLLTGCGNASQETAQQTEDEGVTVSTEQENADSQLDGTWPEEPVKIGVTAQETTDDNFLYMQEYFDYLSEYYNLEFMYSESLASPEDEIEFIDSCASAGCDAIFGFYNISKDEAVNAAVNRGMYYYTSDSGLNENFANEDYFLSGYHFVSDMENVTGDYLAGYEIAYSVAQQSEHVVYCNGGASMGIQMFIDRFEGFKAGIAAAQKEGYNITFDEKEDVIEGWPGTDDFTTAQSNVLNDSSVDAIASSFGATYWLQPVMDAGADVKLAGIEGSIASFRDYVDEGIITTIVYDCPEVVFANAIPMIINAVTGHGELNKNEDGTNASIGVNRWILDDVETFDTIHDFVQGGNYFVTAEDMMQCFPDFNEDASFETVNNMYESLTLEHALEIISQ